MGREMTTHTQAEVLAMADHVTSLNIHPMTRGEIVSQLGAYAALLGSEPVAVRLFDGEGGYHYTDDEETMQRWLSDNDPKWRDALIPHPATRRRDMMTLEGWLKYLREKGNHQPPMSYANMRALADAIDAHLVREVKLPDAMSLGEASKYGFMPGNERVFMDGWNACREAMLSTQTARGG